MTVWFPINQCCQDFFFNQNFIFKTIVTSTKQSHYISPLEALYNLILSAKEQDNPVPSGSTCSEVILPLSTTMEYRLLRI